MDIQRIAGNQPGLYASVAKTAQPADANATGQAAQPGNTIMQAVAQVEEAKKSLAQEMERMRAESESLRLQVEQAKQQGEAAARQFDTLQKCLIIARRIISGDEVPREDYRFLAENEPALYKQAILMRQHKEDPEEYDRLSEDEEEAADGSSKTDTSGRARAKISAPPMPAPPDGGSASANMDISLPD